MSVSADDFSTAAERVLDQVVADTFRVRLGLLIEKERLGKLSVRERLNQASVDLESVRKLQSPNYHDEAVALMHLLRYQFSHVNLAWSMFAASPLRTDVGPDRIQMVDLGAGSFAALFGITLWNAELIACGETPIEATVISAEPSEAMRVAGGTSWVQLHRTAHDRERDQFEDLAPLRDALEIVRHLQVPVADSTSFQCDRQAHRCLVAMHAFYQEPGQQMAISQALKEIWSRLVPHTGLITCYHSHEHWVRRAAPFDTPPIGLTPAPRIANSQLPALRRLGRSIQVERRGRHGAIHHTYPTWGNPMTDTSVLYWKS